jgi:ribose/xylose/arabinose/galactoside ABC-type transport system permease subunit
MKPLSRPARLPSANRSLIIILVGIVILMSLLNPRRFPTLGNVISMSYQLPIIAFLSIGMMLTMLSGGINLAIVATANFTGIITVLLLRALAGEGAPEAPLWISILSLGGGLAAALLVGAVMGWLIAYVEVSAILTTLGAMTLLNGINVVITKGYTLSGFPPFILGIGNGTLFGVPIPFLILIAVCLLLAVLLNRTVFGVSLYLLGSNPVAANYSNIRVRSVLVREYMLSAFFSAITSFIMMGQLNSVKANYAESYLLVSVLACFLGGVDPFGGGGKLSGMVLSVVVLQLVSTGVNLLRMDPFFIRAMWGFIIILLVGVNFFSARFRESRRLRGLRREHETAGPAGGGGEPG